MMKRGALISLVALLLLVSAAGAEDISFGSVGSGEYLRMEPGDSKTFRLAFFNCGKNALYVNIDIEGAGDLDVNIEPDYIVLEPERPTKTPSASLPGYVWVVEEDGYRRARAVILTIGIPEGKNLKTGFYKIKVIAEARTSPQAGAGIRQQVSQVREFTYRVSLPGWAVTGEMEGYEKQLGELHEEPYEYAEPAPGETSTRSMSAGEERTAGVAIGEGGGEQQQQPGRQEETDGSGLPTGYLVLPKDIESTGGLLIMVAMVMIAGFILVRKYELL
jgi:hypothetical protein